MENVLQHLSVSVTGVQHGERSEASLFLSVSVTGVQHGERSEASLFLLSL